MNLQLGLKLYSEKVMLFDPSEMNEITDIIQSDQYHIYLLCKRKKIYFESSVPAGADFCNTVLYYLDEQREKVRLYYQHSSALQIHSHANGVYHITRGGKREEMSDFMLINLLLHTGQDEPEGTPVVRRISDLEVMYIGQSFGRINAQTIESRLANHEKIQRIALDVLRGGTNEELLVVGVTVGAGDLTTALVTAEHPQQVTAQELLAHQQRAQQRPSEGQLITICEAALIRYFQPRLNIEYKGTFPCPGAGSYDELYKIDFDYCHITLAVEPIYARLFSEHVPIPRYVHSQHYPLSSRSDKQQFFDYLLELAQPADPNAPKPAARVPRRRKGTAPS
jgi:hypothetical protein